MWLSGQQKRPTDRGEGQTGIVTVGGDEAAVQLDSERRGLEVYAPAVYDWTPVTDQRVADLSKVLGYAVSLALNPSLSVDDLTMLLE